MKHYRFIILVAVVLIGCKSEVRTSIPKAPVSLEINILRDAPTLNAIGGVATFVAPRYQYEYIGYGGVVIFHNFDDKFVAFDLACPNEVSSSVRLNVDSITGEAICPKCGAIYDIGYAKGYPINDVCKYPMRQYNVSLAGDNLRVFN